MESQQLGILLRPKSFDELIGQEDVVATLKQQFAKGEVSRAMMFIGPPGTGKTTLAHIIAREIQGWEFSAEDTPDVIDVNAANFRKIEDIRNLVDQTQTVPFVGKYRVIILDEAQQITKDAQNLLLKPFEEPNSANVWVICTTDPQKIIDAIKTRCSTYQLTRLSKKNIHDLLVRGAEFLGRTEPFEDFEKEAMLRGGSLGPRAILNAFQNFNNGTPAKEAVMAMTAQAAPEYFDIARAVVYGKWDTDSAVWGKPCKAVRTLISELEGQLKKKAEKEKAAEDEFKAEEGDPDADDIASRPEVARTLRNIVGALLKSVVLGKDPAKASLAADCLGGMATGISANEFDVPLEYPYTIGVLYRVNRLMNKGGK
jgi:DNA polymerase III, delta subunit